MTYVYDANGNIVSKTPYTNVTSSDLSIASQGTAIVYSYGDSNWSDKLTSYNGQTISYLTIFIKPLDIIYQIVLKSHYGIKLPI